ncbi:tetratricopeptide repeat protein, partial [Planctomicrobium sp.]
AMESAYYHSNVDNYENALVYFDLATEIDPDLSVAYSGKGNSLLKLDRHDEALEAFQKAYDMDSFDGQAVTGIGIVSAILGETEKAVSLTVDSADKFPKDNIYAYNTACVYGRAIEYLKKEAPEENSEVIEQYGAQAIQALRDSIEYGFEEFTLMRTDPDINSLRSLPEFKELIKNQL